MSVRPSLNPENWIRSHGDALFRYALCRVRQPQVAEDIVSETLIAAIKAKDRFEGRSSERTWLMAILKHKIIDFYRRKNRLRSFTELGLEFEIYEEQLAQSLTTSVPNPSETAERMELLDAIQASLEKLPSRVAEIFRLSELENVSNDEICAKYGITRNNLWVIMHRARAALRSCLEEQYYRDAS